MPQGGHLGVGARTNVGALTSASACAAFLVTHWDTLGRAQHSGLAFTMQHFVFKGNSISLHEWKASKK